jgi:uracil-DNA glycosylase
LLKDEIKKPYFIALKRFLWDEGVRGADDSPKTLKVYPSRKSDICSSKDIVTELVISARNIYAWSNTPLGRIKVVLVGQDPYHGRGQAHGR